MEEQFVVEKHPVPDVPAKAEQTAVYSPASEPVPAPAPVALVPAPAPADTWTVPAPAKKKHHVLFAILLVLVVLLVAVGIFAFTQYRALMRTVDSLTADGQAIATCITDLSESAKKMDFPAALASAKELQGIAEHMCGLISTREFDVASRIPKYGGDVLTARALLDIVLDADANAAIPLLQALVDHPMTSLVSADGVDAAGIYALLDACDAALPVAEKDLDAVEALDPFVIPQLAEATAVVFDNLPAARSALADLRAKVEQVRPMLEMFVGRDGTGLITELWPLIRLFVGDDPSSLLGLLAPFMGLPAGEGGASPEGIMPLLGLLMGQGGAEGEGEGGGMSMLLPLLGLFTGEGDGDGFSALLPLLGLFTGDTGSETGDSGGTGTDESLGLDSVLPLIGLLFGGGDDGGESQDVEDQPAEGGTDVDLEGLLPLIGLLLGDGEEDGETGFDMSGLLPFLDFFVEE